MLGCLDSGANFQVGTPTLTRRRSVFNHVTFCDLILVQIPHQDEVDRIGRNYYTPTFYASVPREDHSEEAQDLFENFQDPSRPDTTLE